MYNHWYNVLSGMDGWMDEWGRMTRTERGCVPSENVAKTRHQTTQTFPYYTASIDLITDSLSPEMFIHRHVQEQQKLFRPLTFPV